MKSRDYGWDEGELHLTETERMESLLNRVYWGNLAAIQRAGHLGPKGVDALPELTVCLNNRHWNVRLEAVRALGRIGEMAESAVSKLVTLKDDRNPLVREAVDEALASIRKHTA